MPWSDPVNPIPLTVITAAQAIANWINQVRWLRLMTGNADPPGSSYTIVSSSVTATTWSKVTTDLLNDLAVTNGKLAADAVTNLKIAANTISGDSKLVPSTVTGNSGSSAIGAGVIHPNRLVPGAFDATQVDAAFADQSITGDKLVNDSINGEDKIQTGTITGNSGTSSIAAGVIHPNRLVPDAFDATQVGGAFATGAFNATNVNDLFTAQSIHSAKLVDNSITPAQIATGGVGTSEIADDAVTYAKLFSDDTPANGDFVTINTTTGKFEYGTPASVAGVPSGLIAAVRTAAAIPSGWTRFTDGDGRTLIGAASSAVGGLTFTENVAVGTTWLHGHTQSAHTHSMQAHVHGMNGHVHGLGGHNHGGSVGISGTTGGPSATDGLGNGGGVTAPTANHTHSFGGSGSIPGDSGNTAGDSSNSGGPSLSDTGTSSDNAIQNVTGIPIMGRTVVYVIKS